MGSSRACLIRERAPYLETVRFHGLSRWSHGRPPERGEDLGVHASALLVEAHGSGRDPVGEVVWNLPTIQGNTSESPYLTVISCGHGVLARNYD